MRIQGHHDAHSSDHVSGGSRVGFAGSIVSEVCYKAGEVGRECEEGRYEISY